MENRVKNFLTMLKYIQHIHIKLLQKKKSVQKTAGATSGLVGNEIADKITKVSKSSMLKSSLCNYSDAYILVKETITSSGRVTNTATKTSRWK